MTTFRRIKESLLDREGQYVLIQGDKVAGVWPTQDEALQQGYALFELGVFMIKKIERVEKPICFGNIVPCK